MAQHEPDAEIELKVFMLMMESQDAIVTGFPFNFSSVPDSTSFPTAWLFCSFVVSLMNETGYIWQLEGQGAAMSESRYHVTKLYGETGQVAEHFVNDEFHIYCDTWEHAMSNPHFAAIIEKELQAEQIADQPLEHLCELAPNDRVRCLFLSWLGFIDNDLDPWTTGGAIHFRPHWARVLMHALVIGDAMELPDIDLKCLAMAAVFHDSRRSSPYLDTGHGARAAGYYAQECRRFADAVSPNERLLEYDPRTLLAMAWHDRPDDEGISALERFVTEDRIGVPAACDGGAGSEVESAVDGDAQSLTALSCGASFPKGACADAVTILRIFKDADSLDRVRLGDLDVDFLRTEQARKQVKFAYELLAASERPL